MVIFSKIKELKHHKGFMKYFKNTSWLFAEKILRMVVGLFVGIWVARYLGPEQFGLFSYAQSIVALFTVFSNFSMQGIVVKELVTEPLSENEIMGSAFFLRVVCAIIAILFLWCSTYFLISEESVKILVFIISASMLLQSFNVIDFYFQSKVLSKYVVYSNTITLFISSLVKVVLMVIDAPLVAFAWAIVFDGVILILGLIYFYSKLCKFHFFSWKVKRNLIYKLIKDCLPLVPTGFVIIAYMKVDQIMLGGIMNKDAVGYYAAAMKIIEPLYIVPLVLVNSFYPKLIELKNSNSAVFYHKLGHLLLFVYIYALSVALVYFFFSNNIINFLYGPEYSLSSQVLSISGFALIFIGWRFIIGRWFLIENLITLYLITSVVGLVINIFFNYLLIKKYGVIGASYATLLSFIVATYLLYFFSKKTRNIFVLQTKILFFNLRGIF